MPENGGLNITGIGVAFPAQKLAASELGEICGSSLPSWAAAQRRVALPLEYLHSSKNSDPFEGVKQLSETPTDLAERASVAALESAGITAEELGLIIGATETPLETTPSESQRVGKRLGFKTASYDACVGSADSILHAKLLSSWKSDRVPAQTLSCSTNTPSLRTDFSKGDARFIVGDGAVSFIYSPSGDAILTLEAADFAGAAPQTSALSSETLGSMSLDQEAAFTYLANLDQQLVGQNEDAQFFVPSSPVTTSIDMPASMKMVNPAEGSGYLLGTHAGLGLAMAAAQAQQGDRILVSCASLAGANGHAIFVRSAKEFSL